MTDGDLTRRAAAGDEAAFLAIWDVHRDPVYRFAFWMLAEPAAAEDVTQAAFLALLEHPARFDSRAGSLRTYLLAIARNLSRKQLRKLRPEEDLDCEDETPAGSHADPFDRLLILDREEALHTAVAQLPALQREALFLFVFEELSLAEVAALQQVDANAVKARLHRARQRLRKELAWMKT